MVRMCVCMYRVLNNGQMLAGNKLIIINSIIVSTVDGGRWYVMYEHVYLKWHVCPILLYYVFLSYFSWMDDHE